MMEAELVIVEGEDLNRKVPIPPHGKVLIGRHHACEAILDDSNVSKFHSLIIYSPKGSGIVDLGSRNGTFINNRRVKKYALTFGDEIRIGTSVFKFLKKRRGPVSGRHPVATGKESESEKIAGVCHNCSVPVTKHELLESMTQQEGMTQLLCKKCLQLEGHRCQQCRVFVSGEDIATGKGVCYKERFFCENHLPLDKHTPSQVAQYKILMPLGGGSVSNVFKAKHLFMKTIVALKLMHSKLSSQKNIIERFFREAQFGVRFDDHNIIQVYDAGKADNHYYMVLEYFEGETLYEAAMNNPLPVSQVIQIAKQLSQAVNHAHSWGVVHRDIKPSNVLINETGEIKLTDLGAAKQWENPHASDLTQRGQFIGTLRYQPPEQIANASTVDQRADIYAIGTCLYYCLTGEPPFQGNVLAELLDNVLGGKYIPIEERIPQIPEALGKLITSSLQREADKRPQNMAELQAYLDEI